MRKTTIITFATPKGGVAKTTTAFHFIGELIKNKKSYLAIDADFSNQTLYAINKGFRKEPFKIEKAKDERELVKIINEHINNVDFIIIDTGGNSSPITLHALKLADMIITPISSRSVTETIGFVRFRDILSKIGEPKLYLTFSNVDSRIKKFDNAKTTFNKLYKNLIILDSGLKTRALYEESMSIGYSISEIATFKNKQKKAQLLKAKDETKKLYEEVLSWMLIH